jgi:hypothetical protein
MIKRNGLSAGDAQGPKSSKVQELPSEDDEEDSEDDDEDDDEVSGDCVMSGALQSVVVGVFPVLGNPSVLRVKRQRRIRCDNILLQIFFVTTTRCAVPGVLQCS